MNLYAQYCDLTWSNCIQCIHWLGVSMIRFNIIFPSAPGYENTLVPSGYKLRSSILYSYAFFNPPQRVKFPYYIVFDLIAIIS
jgi:hypothetical protein